MDAAQRVAIEGDVQSSREIDDEGKREKMNNASKPTQPWMLKPPAAAYRSTLAPNCAEFEVTA